MPMNLGNLQAILAAANYYESESAARPKPSIADDAGKSPFV